MLFIDEKKERKGSAFVEMCQWHMGTMGWVGGRVGVKEDGGHSGLNRSLEADLAPCAKYSHCIGTIVPVWFSDYLNIRGDAEMLVYLNVIVGFV